MEERINKAVELFKSGYNCSQSVVAAYADLYDLSGEQALRVSASFGAGIGRMRETCGAACGMFILAGLEKGATISKDQKGKGENYRLVQDLAEIFKERNGSINCGELLGLNNGHVVSSAPEERTEIYYKKRPCVKMVEEAARIWAEYLESMKNQREIYFAGGCFWGTEHFLKQIQGVEQTQVGYANGSVENPTYEQVCSGHTEFAETVKVVYDRQVVKLELLIDLFFKTIDPTSLNRQGNDRGTQYRTGIYYTDETDLPQIKAHAEDQAKNYTQPLVVEIKPLTNFYPAERYHQDYLDKNPRGYCHINPALFDLAKKANTKIK